MSYTIQTRLSKSEVELVMGYATDAVDVFAEAFVMANFDSVESYERHHGNHMRTAEAIKTLNEDLKAAD